MDAQEIPEFAKIRTPASPAFIILGITPASVERPTSPVAVATSALSSFTDNAKLLVPKNYALDVAPYWLVSHPTLTYLQYRERNSWDSFWRHLTVSIGTTDSAFKTKDTSPRDTSVKKVGAGIRSILFSTQHADTTCFDSLRRALALLATQKALAVSHLSLVEKKQFADANVALLRLEAEGRKDSPEYRRIDSTRSALERAIAAELKAASDSIGKRNKEALTLANSMDKAKFDSLPESPDKTQLKQANKACAEEGVQQLGFIVSAAAASAWRFPGESFDGGRQSAFGAWLTPAYFGNNNSVIGVLRYIRDDNATTFLGRSASDVGIRDVYAFGKYALSGELVSRRVSDTTATDQFYRASVGFDIKIGEKWLNLAFGKDFKARDAKTLLLLANLQWSIGDDREIKPIDRKDMTAVSNNP